MGDQPSQRSSTNQVAFQLVEDPSSLLPILKARYPQSCFIHNQVINHKKFPEGKFKFYFVARHGQHIQLNADKLWIVSKYMRGGYDPYYSISAPTSIITTKESISMEIFACFSSGGNLINWEDKMMFVALEGSIFNMISLISFNMKLNVTKIHPCYLFYMDPEEALKLDMKFPNLNVPKIQRLSDKNGGLEFLMNTWKNCTPESRLDIPECLKANASSGIFLENGKKCVSGVHTPGFGLLSALYTLKEERGKGYAKMTMYHAYKETAKGGCIPCSTVKFDNQNSVCFHKKLGAKVASFVNWIYIDKLFKD